MSQYCEMTDGFGLESLKNRKQLLGVLTTYEKNREKQEKEERELISKLGIKIETDKLVAVAKAIEGIKGEKGEEINKEELEQMWERYETGCGTRIRDVGQESELREMWNETQSGEVGTL